LLRAGIATAAITATAIAAAPAPALAAVATLSLSSAVGPAATAATITATSTTPWLAGIATPTLTLSLNACQTVYNATASTAIAPTTATSGNIVAGVTPTKLSDYKALIAIPNTAILSPVATATSTKYFICAYAGSTITSALIAQGSYSVAAATGLTSVAPLSGPALGGTTITVTGTGFPLVKGSISGTLGGAALTEVTPISATSFTAITPYHSASTTAVPLTVTTAAGTKTLAGAFTYANGLSISPNTGPNTSAAVWVDVNGAGFSSVTFASTAVTTALTAVGGHVLLVDGAWDDEDNGGAYTNGPVAECGSVVVISDSELICKLNLLAGHLNSDDGTLLTAGDAPVPNGTYTLTVVSDMTLDATAIAIAAPTALPTQTDLSSGATFTVAPY
jgi:hypothetical protein